MPLATGANISTPYVFEQVKSKIVKKEEVIDDRVDIIDVGTIGGPSGQEVFIDQFRGPLVLNQEGDFIPCRFESRQVQAGEERMMYKTFAQQTRTERDTMMLMAAKKVKSMREWKGEEFYQWALQKEKDKQMWKQRSRTPVLVVFPQTGFYATRAEAEAAWKEFLVKAKKAGFEKQLVLSHFPELEKKCADFHELCDALAAKIDVDKTVAQRSVILIGHSMGAQTAIGVARRLGDRVKKVYACAQRSPCIPSANEVFGVKNWQEMAAIEDEALLPCIVDAWPHPILKEYETVVPDAWPQKVKAILRTFLDQYGSPVNPAFADNVVQKEETEINCPILAIGCEYELQKGERPEKVSSMQFHAMGGFGMHTIPETHFSCVSPDPDGSSSLFDFLIFDIAQFVDQTKPGYHRGLYDGQHDKSWADPRGVALGY